ncbi:uncharacterized protein L199_003654 [Kwoniella botswanensis]|uniref:uncharacterized protein n=1 Tax=Kwoniella botswanensis TaxID=1268659 RepID=UPI00315D7185
MVSPTSTISNISPPLITPHASPPIHTQVRRSSSTSTGTTSTKTSESNMLSPEERISKLLSTISSVLVAYSKSLNTSPRYMNSLIEFFHRAISLCPDPKAVPQLPTLPSSTLSSGSNGSSSNTPFSAILLQSHPPLTHNNGDHHNHNTRRNSGHNNLIDTHQHLAEDNTKSQHIHPRKVESDLRGELEGLEEKVRRLEKDRWTSEIVAAW